MKNLTTIVLVAKPSALRDGLRALLMASPQIKDIEQVEDAATALSAAYRLRPAIMIFESFLGSSDLRVLLSQIKQASPSTKCLVLADTVQRKAELEVPIAESVLLQGMPPTELATHIEKLLIGSTHKNS